MRKCWFHPLSANILKKFFAPYFLHIHNHSMHNRTSTALGRAHLPPTKVFRRLRELKPRLALAACRQYEYTNVTDWCTDSHTNRQTDITRQHRTCLCKASRGKNCCHLQAASYEAFGHLQARPQPTAAAAQHLLMMHLVRNCSSWLACYTSLVSHHCPSLPTVAQCLKGLRRSQQCVPECRSHRHSPCETLFLSLHRRPKPT